MTQAIRFGTFIREITVRQKQLRYRELTPEVRREDRGVDRVAALGRLRVRPVDAYRILQPYVGARFSEQLKAVVPLAVYLAIFQLIILRQHLADSWVIAGGLTAVVVGLMLFMEGLKIGLMPFAESIGTILPARARLPVVLLIAFLLGIGATFAEPAIGALKAAGAAVDARTAPYLYALLNDWADGMVLVVGAGVGGAAVLGTLRFLYGWSLKPLVYATLLPAGLLTLYLHGRPELAAVIGLAWDCGGITTGPVTVPLVLSLGIGIAASAGKEHSSLSGFGIVTLASLFPVIGVELLAIYVAHSATPEDIVAAAAAAVRVSPEATPWHAHTPGLEIVLGIRAIVPLALFLLFIMVGILRERIRHPSAIAYGIALCIAGMIVFNVGLSYGLAKLGAQSGGLVPAAFTEVAAVTESPLYAYPVGLVVALVFAWLLGFGATLAEPALNAMGATVENLSNGAFPKSLLMYAVSVGVGAGIAVGVLKIIYALPLAYLLVPAYLVAVVLTRFSTEEFANIAWDGAGVTTGPVTVPLVLALGLGFGNAVGAVDGFGILALASVGPVVTVLATGLWIEWKVDRRHRIEDQPAVEAEAELS